MILPQNYEINPFSLTKEQITYLCDLLNTKKPKNILEYWCWVSSNIFNDYIQENKNSTYTWIEHDKNYKTNNNIQIFNLIDHPYINTNFYNWLEEYISKTNKKFDFILIDGPFWYNKKYDYTRLQMIDPILYNKLDEQWIFLIHDSQRKSTRKSIEILKILFYIKWYNISINYNNYKKDKELITFEFNKSWTIFHNSTNLQKNRERRNIKNLFHFK